MAMPGTWYFAISGSIAESTAALIAPSVAPAAWLAGAIALSAKTAVATTLTAFSFICGGFLGLLSTDVLTQHYPAFAER
jgi:hypothetical protein